MGIEYTICLSRPDKFREIIDNHLSKKVFSRNEMEQLFIDCKKSIPPYLKNEQKLYPEIYDEFVVELISDIKIELYKGGWILYDFAQIDERIADIFFFWTKGINELEISFKGVSEDFNFRVFDPPKFDPGYTDLLNDLKDKNTMIRLLSKSLAGKQYDFWEKMTKKKKADSEAMKKIRKDEHWETWLRYLDAFAIATKNKMYMGIDLA